MEWMKVEIKTTNFGAEIATAVLLESNIPGAEMIDSGERARHLTETAHLWDYADEKLFEASGDVSVIFYIEKTEQGEKLLGDIMRRFSDFEKCAEASAFEIITGSANDEAWLNEWKKFYKPFRVGKIVIVPQWENFLPKENPAADEIVFTIDPGSAFGTGQHQTTQLCILALQKFLRPGDRLADIGCGSGILSIIGLLLGAGAVFACDIDPAGAVAATKKNAGLNPVDISRLQIFSGDALSDEKLRKEIFKNKYEIVVANIVADVITRLVPFVKEILTPQGVFIASGIIDERAMEVEKIFLKNNFEILEKNHCEGWCCIVGKEKNLF